MIRPQVKMFAANDKGNSGAGTTKAAPNTPPTAPKTEAGAASAKPTEGDAAAAKRVKYPVPEAGLTSWPTDHDPKKHKPLVRSDFADECVFLEKKLELARKDVTDLEKEIADVKLLGPGGTSKAKKLVKVQNELDQLKALLAAQGMDVEALLKANAAPKA